MVTNTVKNTIKFNSEGQQNSLLIQPNPVKEQATITLEFNSNKYLVQTAISRLEIYDVVGKKIKTFNYIGLQEELLIDFRTLVKGCYIVKAFDQDNIEYSGKLIKE